MNRNGRVVRTVACGGGSPRRSVAAAYGCARGGSGPPTSPTRRPRQQTPMLKNGRISAKDELATSPNTEVAKTARPQHAQERADSSDSRTETRKTSWRWAVKTGCTRGDGKTSRLAHARGLSIRTENSFFFFFFFFCQVCGSGATHARGGTTGSVR
jgi:hypothetical protein